MANYFDVDGIFEGLGAGEENNVINETANYVEYSEFKKEASSTGYSTVVDLKQSAYKKASGGLAYFKNLLGRKNYAGTGDGPVYADATGIMGGAPGPTYANATGLMGGAPGPTYANATGLLSKPPGPTYANATGLYQEVAGKSPYVNDLGINKQPPDFKSRPNAPDGPRAPVLQSGMGQTREVIGMVKSGFHHDRTKPVEYMDRARAARYAVVMGSKLMRRDTVLDTGEIKKAYIEKFKSDRDKYAAPGSAAGGLGMPKEDQKIWTFNGLIWVCASDGAGTKPTFYTGVGKLDKIHHSSFTGGAAVIGAGEWIVEKGELLKVSAVSGHYLPTLNALYAAVLHMSQAFNGRTTILMYDTISKTWVDRPVREFISAPSSNGRFKVHPEAM